MCKNAALPLSYAGLPDIGRRAARRAGGLEGSAPSPVLSQSTALLTSFSPTGEPGLEPGSQDLESRMSPSTPLPYKDEIDEAPAAGVEPASLGLEDQCSSG